MLRATARAASVARIQQRHAAASRAPSATSLQRRVAKLEAWIASLGEKGDANEKRRDLLEELAAAQRSLAAAQKAREERSARSEAGPITARGLFMSRELKGRGRRSSEALKCAAEKWNALSAEERRGFDDAAAENRSRRDALRPHKGKAVKSTQYKEFVRIHFPAAYKSAMASAADRNTAFAQASAEVARLWRASAQHQAPDSTRTAKGRTPEGHQ
eukprot:TRINITY_DN48093_c0_g1_i1.p1 TRINITY_DN48093_c0_g1~~TRINITY_DN48093_c0_g1_i1.p1  ORF type:complete len:216 (+),score=34.09 TRINITY_DN48093_c0_g1_i1:55-702(+)